MDFPQRFSNLPEYAFPRLRSLLDHHPAGGDVVHMTIGEPKHPMPSFVSDILAQHAHEFAKYPPNDGAPELLTAIAAWIANRYGVKIDPDQQVLTLNGTREGLFNAGLALCPEVKSNKTPNVLIPNPFYQVYAVSTAAVGANPVFVPAVPENGFLPDYASLPQSMLDDTAICFICSPSNPQGAIASADYWRDLINLAEKHDFKIFADECYSEIYRDSAPVGALEMAAKMGADPERVVIFHSLSKRSNLPGLRSGFAAGGPKTIAQMKRLRAYAGAPLPLPLQRVATAAWQDEKHVQENRVLYVKKYEVADQIFATTSNYNKPKAGFFLWLPVDDGETAALKLWQKTGVRVLPGAYLSRKISGPDAGTGYIRVAMVAPIDELQNGLHAIKDCLY
ncbi:aspartate aminotransferase [Amylibacter kogurei]|uniref:Aspartate aminotransferase n=1 Tax=Paramylibacter kogurei TaxID=1889778 RepID=A0A2G5K2D9_9RHOB|nr:aminotransferase class I/II-fold pyridoxal phosphate-dependent enzyme [Amylibacter kogurei]PIB23289.1 aspartate aminotransferase [Amylibacter kogurei]